MTCKEQIKILNDKIKANNVQYDLDRINAEISAYSNGDLDKYEFLTKQDLKYKPDALEQAKFTYSPLGKVFNDGLNKKDNTKKVGILQRLKNIEDNLNSNDDGDNGNRKVGIFQIIKDIKDQGIKIMKLLGSSTDTIDGDKNSELVPKLESVDLVLVHCNLVNNSYQQASKVLFTFVPNKKYGQLITVSPEMLIMLKTVNTEFSFIEIWFTDQDNRPLEIEDSVNISLIVGISNFM